jgi:hypothetical protein
MKNFMAACTDDYFLGCLKDFHGEALISFQYHLMLLLKEHAVFTLIASLIRNLLFEMCSPVDIMLI